MSIFSKKPMGGGILDVIRCDEPSYLIWKWHPEGTISGNNRKENSIRWGSLLRVKDGSVAVFVYNYNGSIHQDYIEGPFDSILDTHNLPVLSNIIGLTYHGESPFQAEVYFINLAHLIQVKFAVPYFDIYDPRFLDFGVPTAVRGTINFHITDYRNFVTLHRLDQFTMSDFQTQIKDAVIRSIKSVVANAPEEYGIPVVQLERKIDQINEIVQKSIKERFINEYGVTVSSVDIAMIDVDKTSDGYRQLKTVTQDLTTSTMRAKTAVDIDAMRDNQKLDSYERERQIDEDAYARHKQIQTAHLNAYQTEVQGQVGIAGAQGLGMLGADSGGMGNSGMNPAAMMAGMAIGNAIGQNIAGNINNAMSSATPPPIPQSQNIQSVPKTTYNVAINGQPTGPFEIDALKSMIEVGMISNESLVWTQGMIEWKRICDVDELKSILNGVPPIPQ